MTEQPQGQILDQVPCFASHTKELGCCLRPVTKIVSLCSSEVRAALKGCKQGAAL